MLVNHLIIYGDGKVGLRVPILADGYLRILDSVCLFGIMCTLAEDAVYLLIHCVATLCVQHRTVKNDHGFINGVSKFRWG